MMRRILLAVGASASMLTGCTVQSASPQSITLAAPSVRQEGQVAIYSELCEVPSSMRAIADIEVPNNGRERSAVERDLADRAGMAGANAIVLHPHNRWALNAAYTSAEPNSFDPFRFSRATAVMVLHGRPTTTSALADNRTGSVTCGAR